MSPITLFRARKIITMDPNIPVATHVAVRDGRILAIGGENCADAWGEVTPDLSLADTVLMPGLIEGHAHMMAGAMWRYSYVGFHDRIDPEGQLWKGLDSVDAVIGRLRDYAATLAPDEPIVAWGFDPIFLEEERLNKSHLDRISTTRPVAVLFSNFHLLCANSAALDLAGYDAGTNAEGVMKGPDGAPNGELQEMAAMFPVMRRLGIDFRGLSKDPASIRAYGQVALRAGVTTATDLYSHMQDEDLEAMLSVTGQADFPLRIVVALAAEGDPSAVAARAQTLAAHSTDRLHLGAVKLMTDGAIQGWTARMKWPGYVGGQANGIWNTAPAQIHALCLEMHRQGVQMHIHVNGDEAAEVTLDALEAAARAHSSAGHRHVLQHCQMMTPALYARAKELGVCCNIFSNHIYYFGDKHVTHTIGRDRANRMDAARSALDLGVHVALHSDAPVTPLGPLFTAWCAVNRRTMSGDTLGAEQCITVDEALYAITMGAAYTLKLDADIGSISVGKIADFAVLGDDPTEVAPIALKDVPVRGVVAAGRVHLV